MPEIHVMYDEADRLKDEGHYEQAIAKLQEVLQADPSHVLSHLALAVLYGRTGQHEQAVEHGVRACQLDPHDAFNFTALSVTYHAPGRGHKRATIFGWRKKREIRPTGYRPPTLNGRPGVHLAVRCLGTGLPRLPRASGWRDRLLLRKSSNPGLVARCPAPFVDPARWRPAWRRAAWSRCDKPRPSRHRFRERATAVRIR